MKVIVNYLKTFNLTSSEISDLFKICPALNYLDLSRIMKNVNLLTQYGYPATEIDFLIMSNPSFFAYDEKELKNKLISLTKNNENLEELLKENPYLI